MDEAKQEQRRQRMQRFQEKFRKTERESTFSFIYDKLVEHALEDTIKTNPGIQDTSLYFTPFFTSKDNFGKQVNDALSKLEIDEIGKDNHDLVVLQILSRNNKARAVKMDVTETPIVYIVFAPSDATNNMFSIAKITFNQQGTEILDNEMFYYSSPLEAKEISELEFNWQKSIYPLDTDEALQYLTN